VSLAAVRGHPLHHAGLHRPEGVPAACPADRSTPGSNGHFRTTRYTGSPADRQADPLRACYVPSLPPEARLTARARPTNSRGPSAAGPAQPGNPPGSDRKLTAQNARSGGAIGKEPTGDAAANIEKRRDKAPPPSRLAGAPSRLADARNWIICMRHSRYCHVAAGRPIRQGGPRSERHVNDRRQVRDGAWVADITGMLDTGGWPAGMRVTVRKERPHPGAQLRFTDIDGHRFTAFATDAKKGQLADLELRHRRRARWEVWIRCAKDTGLRNLPLKGYAQNQVWYEIVALACQLLAWTQMLALAGAARRWEPKRFRLRVFAVAGRLARSGRRLRLRLAERWPWAAQVTVAAVRLQALPSGWPAGTATTTRKENTRARGTPPTRRDSRAARHGRTPKTAATDASSQQIRETKDRG
jgi:Transposase DDE domain group 1